MTPLRVSRQRRPSQNLGGHFVVFFLGDQNRNFVKVKGLKLQLNQKYIFPIKLTTVEWKRKSK